MRAPDGALAGEYLPATVAAEQELVLLHGWGSDRGIWRPLLPLLRPWANITLMDLPGCAPGVDAGEAPQLEPLLAAVLALAPGVVPDAQAASRQGVASPETPVSLRKRL